MMQMIRKMFLFAFMVLVIAPQALEVAVAEAQATLEAEVVSLTGNGTIAMAPGDTTTVSLKLKNAGSTAWKNDGPGYISLYTFDPKYRRSEFDSGTWLWWNQVKRIQEAHVDSGGIATMSFDLRAPQKEGRYTEVFHLASEDRAWVTGGKIVLTIDVAKSAAVAVPAPAAPAAPIATTETSSAEIVAQTVADVHAKGGSSINVQVAVKNTSVRAWEGFGILPPTAQIASPGVRFNDSSWGATQVAYIKQRVAPGEVASLSFNLRAPNKNGRHIARFEIITDEGRRTNEYVEVSIAVTDSSGNIIDDPIDAEATNYVEEPTLRIGTLIVDEEVNHEVYLRSNTSELSIQNLAGEELDRIPMGTQVWAAYANGLYSYRITNEVKTSATALRFVPVANTDILEVVNFDRRVTRRSSFPDNTFRGTLELRYNASKDRTWLINELPIELYLRGIAETSDSSPHEYQRAMMIAARTFAFYHRTHDTKWRKEFFTITAYSYDQVYNGYGQESRSPNIVKAVEETAGEVVTYGGELIVTPYFSRSDGRTRDWSEVWNGSVPWAKSVSVPCEKGKTLLGHGVGISAQGAICLAKDGMTGEEILKYFYTGVEVTKRWE